MFRFHEIHTPSWMRLPQLNKANRNRAFDLTQCVVADVTNAVAWLFVRDKIIQDLVVLLSNLQETEKCLCNNRIYSLLISFAAVVPLTVKDESMEVVAKIV